MEQALTAYRAHLASDATLVGMLSTFKGEPSIFIDTVPEGASLPFICINSPVSDLPHDTKSRKGRELLMDFRVTAVKTGSTASIGSIASRMRTLLHRAAVPVSGYTPIHEEALGPIVDDVEDAYSRIITLRILLGGQ